jgi:virginiamycin A acetyltransferase
MGWETCPRWNGPCQYVHGRIPFPLFRSSDVKVALKHLGDLLAIALMAPAVLTVRAVWSLGADRAQTFAWVSQWAASWWGPLGVYCRRALYRRLLQECASDVCIAYGTIFSRPGARLGRRVYLGAFCNIGLAHLEDDVLLGSGVHILSGKYQHYFDRADMPIREQGGRYEVVHVGKGSWIGNGAIVLADVGEGCVVAAGSVVTKTVEDGAVVAGNPAKLLARRPSRANPSGEDAA